MSDLSIPILKAIVHTKHLIWLEMNIFWMAYLYWSVLPAW